MNKVGDIVFASFGHFGTTDVKRGTVTKVTPKGQIVVDFGEVWGGNGQPRLRRFHPHGPEIGGEIYKSGHIINEDNYAIAAVRQARQDGAAAIVAHLRSWSWRTKAELNELVAKLVELADRIPDDESTASGIEARKRPDREAGLDPEGESPVAATSGETPNHPSETP
jgi:hypothetical protein